MSLRQRVSADLKAAMKAKDAPRTSALRMLNAALLNLEKSGSEVDEVAALGQVRLLIKQRRESAEMYRKGQRPEAAASEENEITVLEAYLPAALDEGELASMVEAVVIEMGAQSPRQMGAVMARLKERLGGRADMGELSRRVKQRLGGG
ncbi:MAG: GatB/YqeY domain-containing protein [Magnetococcus sp. WYHC-3]